MHLAQIVTIRRAPEEVFRWIENPELATRWQPDVMEYEITKAVPGMVGTEFRERVGEEGGSAEMRGRVTAYVPDRRMGFELTGQGLRVRAGYTLRPADDGATELRAETDIRMKGRAVALLFRRRIARQLRAELDRLRILCEADGDAETDVAARDGGGS